jgi:hypothetical protein
MSGMTAINVIRQGDGVHIISDGAFCDANGILCEIVPNTWLLPHLPAAVAIHGSPHLMPFLMYRLSRECHSLDEIAARIANIAIDVHISFPMTHGTLDYGNIKPEFDLIIAGWSAQDRRPKSLLVTCPDRTKSRNFQTGWKVLELSDMLIAPPITEQVVSSIGWKVPDSAEAFRADVDGLKLLQAQRLLRGPMNPRSSTVTHGFMVGGFVQLTSISEHGVNTRILHRWPDEIGRRIDPHKG